MSIGADLEKGPSAELEELGTSTEGHSVGNSLQSSNDATTGPVAPARQESPSSRVIIVEAPSDPSSEDRTQPTTFIPDRKNESVSPTHEDVGHSNPLHPDPTKAREVVNFLYRMNIIRAEMMLYKEWMKCVANEYPRQRYWEELHNNLKRYSEAEKLHSDFKRSLEAEPSVPLDETTLARLVNAAERIARQEIDFEKQEQSLDFNLDAYGSMEYVLLEARKQLSPCSQEKSLRQDDFAHTRVYATSDAWAKKDSRDRKQKKTFYMKLSFAVCGGFALIIPMLIMTLHQTRLTTLLTTSLFVFAVAVILSALMNDAEPKDIVGATAAYAAVLVVFVGTTGGTPASGEPNAGEVAGIVIGALAAGCLLVAMYASFAHIRFVLLMISVLFDEIRAMMDKNFAARRQQRPEPEPSPGAGWGINPKTGMYRYY